MDNMNVDYVGQLGPQPDFNLMAQSMASFSEELPKLGNLPAVQQGQQILHVLQQIQARLDHMDARFDALNARFDNMNTRMDARFDALDARLKARFQVSDHNSFARLVNSHTTTPGVILEPLKSIEDNTIIETLRGKSMDDIRGLSNPELGQILEALGVDPSGTGPTRLKKVFMAVGVVNGRLY